MEKLKALLDELVGSLNEIIAVVLTTTDGFPLGFASKIPIDAEREAAAIASLASLSTRSTDLAGIGPAEEILITSEIGRIFVYPIGELTAIGIITVRDVTTALVLLKVRQLLPEIEAELERLLGDRTGGSV